MKIAIIGGGAAGMTCAWLLDKEHDITLYEKQSILGGNVRTLGKNVAAPDLPENVCVDNGVIEFQTNCFNNVAKLFNALEVETETLNGGNTGLFMPNGKCILGPGLIKANNFGLLKTVRHYIKLASVACQYAIQPKLDLEALSNIPVSRYLQDKHYWHIWQKLLLMYAYSIPYPLIAQFPAEIALPVLRRSGVGTQWFRVIGGVFSYMQKIIDNLQGQIICDASIRGIERNNGKIRIQMQSGETCDYDKLIIATPPDQVLSLLADPREIETERFASWQPNLAETIIHTDNAIYSDYDVNSYSEFDLFQQGSGREAGYNAYLNHLCGLPDATPKYHLSYNLSERIDPGKIIDRQKHHTPLYTVEALRHRSAVIEDNGSYNVYYAGAWLGDGLHEGAVSSAIVVARLLNNGRCRLG